MINIIMIVYHVISAIIYIIQITTGMQLSLIALLTPL